MQTNALGRGKSKETETRLTAIGTGFLEVLERLEHVADQCIEFGRVQGFLYFILCDHVINHKKQQLIFNISFLVSCIT